MKARAFAATLIAEADSAGESSQLGGCWLVTSATLIADQAGWDDGDASKDADFTACPYWIITDDGTDPEGVTGADDADLRAWSDQYAPTDAARQARSRQTRASAGGRQIAVMLTPASAAKLAAWVARGETIAGVVNRLLAKSRP